MTKKLFKIMTITYLIMLGALFGASIYAGAVVAPTIFHSEQFFGGEILSQFQEGLLMTSNFEKLGTMVTIGVFFALFYEATKWKSFESDRWTLISLFFFVASGLLFSGYYIPDIIEMQRQGEAMTQSQTFKNVHFASELDFKLFAFSALALLILNLKKALR